MSQWSCRYTLTLLGNPLELPGLEGIPGSWRPRGEGRGKADGFFIGLLCIWCFLGEPEGFIIAYHAVSSAAGTEEVPGFLDWLESHELAFRLKNCTPPVRVASEGPEVLPSGGFTPGGGKHSRGLSLSKPFQV